ncbi:unnamed protein product [Peronospora belbahrii]|uniref:RING-type domain-containing protein n=1 Tax=Peronospora belbahrii TaxID=622444 RepID=A0ABN8DEK4_9STRA|nr:unnamed protein product [Peronospora belbahrii]
MDENEEERRERITARAEEILRGKRCVGMLVGTTCPVCLMDDVDTQLSGCGHLIHAKCIKRWVQSAGTYLPEDEEGIQTEDDTSYEWGWFEDFDEGDNGSDGGFSTKRSDMVYLARRSLPTFPASASMKSLTTPILNRQMSSRFNMFRTFPPLREIYDTPYHLSKYSWMRVLPSHRHIAANIQIHTFRIVEAKSSKEHAEYLIEMQLDGHYFSRWRRFSEIYRFVNSLNRNQFRQSMVVWQPH